VGGAHATSCHQGRERGGVGEGWGRLAALQADLVDGTVPAASAHIRASPPASSTHPTQTFTPNYSTHALLVEQVRDLRTQRVGPRGEGVRSQASERGQRRHRGGGRAAGCMSARCSRGLFPLLHDYSVHAHCAYSECNPASLSPTEIYPPPAPAPTTLPAARTHP